MHTLSGDSRAGRHDRPLLFPHATAQVHARFPEGQRIVGGSCSSVTCQADTGVSSISRQCQALTHSACTAVHAGGPQIPPRPTWRLVQSRAGGASATDWRAEDPCTPHSVCALRLRGGPRERATRPPYGLCRDWLSQTSHLRLGQSPTPPSLSRECRAWARAVYWSTPR